MQRPDKEKVRTAWERLAGWKDHQRIVRMVCLMVALMLFLVVLPASARTSIGVSLLSHTLLAGMLIVFSLLAISLIWTTGQKIDSWGFLFFNLHGPRPIWLDGIMSGFTQIGSGITTLLIALVLSLGGNSPLAYDLVLSTLTLWLLVEVIKFFVYRSRPFIRLTQTRIIGKRAFGRSFPSGHTSQAFFLATLLTQHFHPHVLAVFLLYAVAAFVGVTRMYVGAHYPRDVLAGAILGSVWGLMGSVATEYLLKGFW